MGTQSRTGNVTLHAAHYEIITGLDIAVQLGIGNGMTAGVCITVVRSRTAGETPIVGCIAVPCAVVPETVGLCNATRFPGHGNGGKGGNIVRSCGRVEGNTFYFRPSRYDNNGRQTFLGNIVEGDRSISVGYRVDLPTLITAHFPRDTVITLGT